MSPDRASEPAESLRRGLALRIGVALAALVVLGVLAAVVANRSDSEPPSNTGTLASAREALSVSRAQPQPAPIDETARTVDARSQAAGNGQGASQAQSVDHGRDGGAAERPAVDPAAAARADRFDGPTRAPADAESPSARAGGDGRGPPSETAQADADKAASDRARADDGKSGPDPARSAAAGQSSASVAAVDPAAPQAAEPAARTPIRAPSDKPPRGARLQAGVFLQPANANALKASLEAKGLPVYIESRVYVGPFHERKEAERARETLQKMGVSSVLIGK